MVVIKKHVEQGEAHILVVPLLTRPGSSDVGHEGFKRQNYGHTSPPPPKPLSSQSSGDEHAVEHMREWSMSKVVTKTGNANVHALLIRYTKFGLLGM